jgi:hypothetical protein
MVAVAEGDPFSGFAVLVSFPFVLSPSVVVFWIHTIDGWMDGWVDGWIVSAYSSYLTN